MRKQEILPDLWEKPCFILCPHVERNIPKTNIAHVEQMSACNEWLLDIQKIETVPILRLVRYIAITFITVVYKISDLVCSLRALSASSRKASASEFPRVQTAFLSWLRTSVLHEECLPPALHGSCIPVSHGRQHPRRWTSIYPRNVRQYMDIDLCIRKARDGEAVGTTK